MVSASSHHTHTDSLLGPSGVIVASRESVKDYLAPWHSWQIGTLYIVGRVISRQVGVELINEVLLIVCAYQGR